MKKTTTTKPEATKPEATKPEAVKVSITGLTVKGIPSTAEKVYGYPLRNGKENSYFRFTIGGKSYIAVSNFDSFDFFVRENIDDVKTAEISATYKLRENGKTVSEMSVDYNGDNGETFPSLRQFYDRKGTGGIDTATIYLSDVTVLYVNRMSRFREIVSNENGAEITRKVV